MVGMALSSATLAFWCLGGPSKSRTCRPGLQGAALATVAPLWVPPCAVLDRRPVPGPQSSKVLVRSAGCQCSAMEAEQPTHAGSTVYTHRRPRDRGSLLA